MSKNDYYQVLGVERGAGADEIKRAYKKLAKKHHPDCNPGDKCAEDKFKEISEAYHVLSDPEKRREYDMFGQVGGNGRPSGQPGWSPGPGSWGPGAGYAWGSSGGPDINLEDIFGGGGGGGAGIGDLFSELFGGAGRRGGRRVDFGGFGADHDPSPASGRDIEADLTISFDDAIKGGTHRFTLRRDGACPTCGGSGRSRTGKSRPCAACDGQGKRQAANAGANFTVVCSACQGSGKVFTDPCASCGGSGRSAGSETISVKIPAGVKDGGRLRIPGKGEPGPSGRAGDLYLRVHVTPHPYFRREGDDLHLELPVTLAEAALGAAVEVPTLEGSATLKIPAGTQSGSLLRMKGKGAPSPTGGRKGDLYVHLKVAVPRDPDPKTRDLLEQLKQLEPDPRKGKF